MQNLTRGKMVNGFDPDATDALDSRTREMVSRRARLLGPAYRLFYSEPVEFVHGEGVILYDRDGQDYLDAYNNVVSVGHAHPRVVEAIARQSAQLCTHTRYLQGGILDYAEDLLPSFGGDIAHLMLTCTGSEANELALRIARHRTGRQGVIVTREAYHGNSAATAEISPSLGVNSPLGTWTRQVAPPDSYRNDPAELGARMAKEVEDAAADLERHGDGLAAFVCDSLFSSDGIYSEPGVLGPVADAVHRVGGLFIADEVQSGFARSGSALWGFQRHDVSPDIVTMGKPMGNGYPVAGVAVTSDAVASFGHAMRYFNTFGGNTVAVAAAQATYDIIRDEELMPRAKRLGDELRAAFWDLAERHPCIGDVRGAGLYIGVELVKSGTRQPDGNRALAVVNAMRTKRVLISATGLNANVLKIRPPLAFGREHVDRLVSALDSALFETI